jgi:hypothetical protein
MNFPIVSRETSKGLLLVSVVDGKIVATLENQAIGSDFGTMPRAIPTPNGLLTHHVGMCALYAIEAAMISARVTADRAAYLRTPAGRRAALVSALGDDSAFPGTRAWLANDAARKALAAFDAAHPEVLASNIEAHDGEIATDGVGCCGGL